MCSSVSVVAYSNRQLRAPFEPKSEQSPGSGSGSICAAPGRAPRGARARWPPPRCEIFCARRCSLQHCRERVFSVRSQCAPPAPPARAESRDGATRRWTREPRVRSVVASGAAARGAHMVMHMCMVMHTCPAHAHAHTHMHLHTCTCTCACTCACAACILYVHVHVHVHVCAHMCMSAYMCMCMRNVFSFLISDLFAMFCDVSYHLESMCVRRVRHDPRICIESFCKPVVTNVYYGHHSLVTRRARALTGTWPPW